MPSLHTSKRDETRADGPRSKVTKVIGGVCWAAIEGAGWRVFAMNAIALWSPLYAQQMAIACVEGDCAEPVVGMMPWLCLGILGTSALAISNPSVGLIALAAPSLFSSLTLAVWSALDAPDEQQPVLNASLRQALETMVLLSVLWTVLWTLVLLWTLAISVASCLKGEVVWLAGWRSRVPRRTADPTDVCPICLELLDSTRQLMFCTSGCGKPCHRNCFRRWLRVKQRCPHCNLPM
jgi:hypothetical protein